MDRCCVQYRWSAAYHGGCAAQLAVGLNGWMIGLQRGEQHRWRLREMDGCIAIAVEVLVDMVVSELAGSLAGP